MLRRGLVKCSSLFFIVFLMCPRRIRPTTIGKQNYFHAVRRSNDFDVIAQPFECCNRFQNDDDVFQSGVNDEPGFDLSDDEIRKFKLWPKGIIPYYIDAVSFQDKVLRDRIRSYLNSVNTQTRLNFVELPSPPKDDDTRWVFFANRRSQLGCADHSILNFTNEGVQHVNLGYDCLSTGGELAEAVLVIAGVPPQHNAPNRDYYITIREENIMPEKKYLFQKLNNDDWLFHDIEYDLTSASHYHHHKYSINGQPTIEFAVETLRRPISNAINKIKMMGDSHGFSRVDVDKLRMLYNYIVKKEEDKVPECYKLFRKGHNFDNQPLHIPDITKPRQKPNKYLGLPEEKNDVNENANSDKGSEYEQINGYDEEVDSGDNDQHNVALQEFAGERVDNHDVNTDYEQLNAAATRKVDLKSLPMKLKQKLNKIDPFLYLSDYQTDGRRRKASEKNTTLKAVNAVM